MFYDLIIIGAGPAGITAGIYAARKKLKTLLITHDFIGQVGKAFVIENYPGFEEIRGLELIEKMRNHVEKFRVKIREGERVSQIKKEDGVFQVKTKKGEYLSRAVIVATGRDPRPLEVPGEKEFLGKGVGYCVICDGILFQGKTVAVVGGGNSGFGAALELSGYCPKVYLLHINDKPNADGLVQERVGKNKKIKVILNAKTKKIKGDKMVTSLVYENVETKKTEEMAVQGVFIEIGYIPATGFVRGLVEFNRWDEIVVDPQTCITRTPGLFAAGDVTSIPVKQIITAAGDGCKAALSAYQYLQKPLSRG